MIGVWTHRQKDQPHVDNTVSALSPNLSQRRQVRKSCVCSRGGIVVSQNRTASETGARVLKAGDGFQIPPETPHAGGKPGEAKSRILITYVVDKGKPLASPA